MTIVSDQVFHWILTALVGGVSAVWFLYDAVNLWRARNLDRTDPLARDRQFGYLMGVVIATIGVVGALRYHGLI